MITTVGSRSHNSSWEVGSGRSPDFRTFRDSSTAEHMHALNRLRPARLGNTRGLYVPQRWEGSRTVDLDGVEARQ